MTLFRRIIAGLLLAALLLPIVVCVLLGVGRLLAAMQDAAGAAVLDRLALAGGILWAIDLIALVIAIAVVTIGGPGEPPADG